jgi:hypothetical protein
MTTTDAPSENRIISIRTSRFENFAKLSVSDLGPGIPEDKLKEVFEPFFTGKAKGMGMGLSIARTIIEAHHHGLISATNRDHGGASFRIKLPLVPMALDRHSGSPISLYLNHKNATLVAKIASQVSERRTHRVGRFIEHSHPTGAAI